MRKSDFKFYKQLDVKDCGPTCLKMIAHFYGRDFNLEILREYCEINKDGVSFLGILNAAQKIGLKGFGAKIGEDKIESIKLPCIIHWDQNHFVVLYKILRNKFFIADPGKGKYALSKQDFFNKWLGNQPLGVCLLIDTTAKFYENSDKISTPLFSNSRILLTYIKKYKRSFSILAICLALSSILQFLTPFLTQAIVDTGINSKDLKFITVVIISQIALLAGRATIEFIRTWILLYISVRINISILTDFFIKLMKLPLAFFDSKMTGDILQRVNDQKRIESFLTGPALNTIFSFFNLIVFSLILLRYSTLVFTVFLCSTLSYGTWVAFFMKKRRLLDFSRFEFNSKNQSTIVQLVNGMQEIKLNNCEQQKRWHWESIQAKLFKYDIKSALLTQYQQGGGTFINEAGNAIIILICAGQVINGRLTLGAMIAVQFIIGQLAGSVQQFLLFVQSFQDASISLERLAELNRIADEQKESNNADLPPPGKRNINIRKLYFRYPGAGNQNLLEDLNLSFPEGKTTAIVGMSGSGKTTILKLLLRFYEPESGFIKVGTQDLSQINFKKWRSDCGVVMQEGYIFSDSLLRNIVVEDDIPDVNKLEKAIKIANIQEFVDSLPLRLNTQIGSTGNGISQGQRQRILIARAVYKNPSFLFFDEATNALDANNETVVMSNLKDFFSNKTVIIVAHRLSTVTGADNIIVLNNGKIVEQGNHMELVSMRGAYFTLIKNQLELGV